MNDFTITLYYLARDLSKDLGDGLASRAAAAIDATFAGQDLRAIAIQYVIDEARDIARTEVARVEREATLARLQAELPDLPEHVRERWEYMSEADRDRARQDAARWREIRLRDEAETEGHVGRMQPGSTSQDNPCGQCQRCREAWERYDELFRKHIARLDEIHQQYREELKAELYVEWTTELLSAEIAMPDGSRTTWGMATVEQHRLRRDMLAKNAAANAESAARHDLAIDALTVSGVPNLAALVAQGRDATPEPAGVAA